MKININLIFIIIGYFKCYTKTYNLHKRTDIKFRAFFISILTKENICYRKNYPNGSGLGMTPRLTATDG